MFTACTLETVVHKYMLDMTRNRSRAHSEITPAIWIISHGSILGFPDGVVSEWLSATTTMAASSMLDPRLRPRRYQREDALRVKKNHLLVKPWLVNIAILYDVHHGRVWSALCSGRHDVKTNRKSDVRGWVGKAMLRNEGIVVI